MRRVAVVLALIALTVAACGGGAGSDGAVTTTRPSGGTGNPSETTEPVGVDATVADTQGNAPPSGVAGVITVDGESIDAQVLRCQPISTGREPHEDDLAVVAFIDGSGGLNVDVSFTTGIDVGTGEEYLQARLDLLYSASGAEGLIQFESGAQSDVDGNWFIVDFDSAGDPVQLDQAPFLIDGNRLTGALTLPQSWPEGGNGVVDIRFDLDVPSEFHPDC